MLHVKQLTGFTYDNLPDAPDKEQVNNLIKTFSTNNYMPGIIGNAFPEEPSNGMLCYRLDENILYQYISTEWIEIMTKKSSPFEYDTNGNILPV